MYKLPTASPVERRRQMIFLTGPRNLCRHLSHHALISASVARRYSFGQRRTQSSLYLRIAFFSERYHVFKIIVFPLVVSLTLHNHSIEKPFVKLFFPLDRL